MTFYLLQNPAGNDVIEVRAAETLDWTILDYHRASAIVARAEICADAAVF